MKMREMGDAGKRSICRHFGECSGRPIKWDARRLAIVLWINEIRSRFGGEPVSTRNCIGHGMPPEAVGLIKRMASEALQIAMETVEGLKTGLTTRESEAVAYQASLGHKASVYFVHGISGGPIKIGKSTDIPMRLAALQSGSPVPLRLLAVQCGGLGLESALHRRFAAHRLHGEWFEPITDLLVYIERLKGA